MRHAEVAWSGFNTSDVNERAAGAIHILAVNEENKVTLMKLGAGPKSLKLLDKGTPGAREDAAGAICSLAIHEHNKATLIVEAAGRGHAWC